MTVADKTDHFENISIMMIVGGFVLYFLKAESSFFWIMLGFLTIGVISLIREVRIKSPMNWVRIVRIILPLLAIVLVLRGIFYGGVGFLFILIILIMYTFLKRKAIS